MKVVVVLFRKLIIETVSEWGHFLWLSSKCVRVWYWPKIMKYMIQNTILSRLHKNIQHLVSDPGISWINAHFKNKDGDYFKSMDFFITCGCKCKLSVKYILIGYSIKISAQSQTSVWIITFLTPLICVLIGSPGWRSVA